MWQFYLSKSLNSYIQYYYFNSFHTHTDRYMTLLNICLLTSTYSQKCNNRRQNFCLISLLSMLEEKVRRKCIILCMYGNSFPVFYFVMYNALNRSNIPTFIEEQQRNVPYEFSCAPLSKSISKYMVIMKAGRELHVRCFLMTTTTTKIIMLSKQEWIS